MPPTSPDPQPSAATAAVPVAPLAPRRGFASRLFGYDVFISFALGPAPRGSQSYASDLARRLRERDFTVFFSEDEAPPGNELDDTLKSALRRSRILVVIANRATLIDPRWVRLEVETFRRLHPGRPVIPISIGGALQDPACGPQADTWLGFTDRIWIDESQTAGDQGVISDSVLARLATAPTAVRASTRWRWTVRTAFAVLSSVTVVALWFAYSDRQNATAARAAERQALSGRLSAESQLARMTDARFALLLAHEAWNTDRTMEARRALYEALHEPVPMRLGSGLGELRSATFASDGRFIAASGSDERIHLWNAQNRRAADPPLRAAAPVRAIAFSPDGATLASLDATGQVQLWDPGSEKPTGDPLKPPEIVSGWALTWHPDGKTLAVAGAAQDTSQVITLWDVATRTSVGEPFRARDNFGIFKIAFSPNGKRLAATISDRIEVWNLDTQEPLQPPIPARPATRHVTFLSDDRLAFDGPGYEVTLWDLYRRSAEHPSYAGHMNWVGAFGHARQGNIVATGSEDTTIRLWERDFPRPLRNPLRAHDNGLSALAFNADGSELVSAARDGQVIQWLLDTGSHRFRLPLAEQPDRGRVDITFSDDGRWQVTLRDGGKVEWRDRQDGSSMSREGIDADEGLAVARDGTLAARSRSSVTLFERGDARVRCTTRKGAFSVDFSPDGAVLVTRNSDDPSVQLWRATDCSALQTIPREGQDVAFRPVAFSTHGQHLLVADDKGVRFWDLAARAFSEAPVIQARSAIRMASDPRGRYVATAHAEGIVRVFRQRDGSPVAVLSGPHGRTTVRAVAFSSDGLWLASAADDGQFVLWDLATNQAAGSPIKTHQGQLRSISFPKDSRQLMTTGTDGPAALWHVDADAWAQQACRVAQRNLTCAEWRRVLGIEPYRKTCAAFPLPEDAASCAVESKKG